MISDARKAWLMDNLHTFLHRKMPNLVKLFDFTFNVFKKQRDHLLDERFRDEITVVKEKAKPYFWAYLAGCLAPLRHRRKTARSS